MRRRDFVTVLAGATAWMSAARGQEPRRIIGILNSAYKNAYPAAETALLQGLKERALSKVVTSSSNGAGLRVSTAVCLAGRGVAKPQRDGDHRLGCPGGLCSKGSNQDHPDCLHDRCRSGREAPRREFQPTGGQPYRGGRFDWWSDSKALGNPARAGPLSHHNRVACQHERHRQQLTLSACAFRRWKVVSWAMWRPRSRSWFNGRARHAPG